MKCRAVILSFNHANLTQRCVESVLKYFQSQEIFLVHNGSKREAQDQLTEKFPRIQHLILQDNRGFSGGANFGIEAAVNSSATDVFFLSNDTFLESFEFNIPKSNFYLAAPVIKLRNTKRVHSLGGEVCLSRGRLSHLVDLKHLGPLALGRSGSDTVLTKNEPGTFYVPGAAFVIGAETWEKTGGFDEKLGTYWEDVDLSLRTQKRGGALLRAPAIVLRHGIAKTCGNDPLYTTYFFHRNRRKIVTRHGRFLQKLSFYPYYFLTTSGKLFKLLRKKDFLRAKLLLKATVS